jgi:hypothetical protein
LKKKINRLAYAGNGAPGINGFNSARARAVAPADDNEVTLVTLYRHDLSIIRKQHEMAEDLEKVKEILKELTRQSWHEYYTTAEVAKMFRVSEC